MKNWHKLAIVGGGVFFILSFLLIVPVIMMDKSWLWFFIPLGFFTLSGIVVGIIFLIAKIKKPKPVQLKIDIGSAKKRAIYEMKMDTDNPDNFRIEKSLLRRVGREGAEMTPIGVFIGTGTELNQKRVVIMNLNNPKKESTHLVDPSDDEIEIAIKQIAENPPEEIKQEITQGIDAFGRPITTTKIRKPSSIVKEEKEKKETEEANAI